MPDLDRMTRDAERNHDARVLVFIALRRGDSERIRLADEAVALDPRLTWIYAPLLLRDRLNPSAPQWIARLQAWDPDNSLPWILEADRQWRAAVGFYPKWEKLSDNAAWRALMEKAFAAPRYDSYIERRLELDRAVLAQYRIEQPLATFASLLSPIAPVGELERAVTWMLIGATSPGPLPPPLAARTDQYWQAARVGQQLLLGSGTWYEKMVAIGIQDNAYQQLEPVLKQQGRNREAEIVTYERRHLNDLKREVLRNNPERRAQEKNFQWGALLMHTFALVTVFAGLVIVVALGWTGLRALLRRPVSRRTIVVLTYGPLVLCLAIVAMALAYHPYGQLFRAYMNGGLQPQNMGMMVAALASLFIAPARATNWIDSAQAAQLFWWTLIAVGTLGPLIFLVLRRRPAHA